MSLEPEVETDDVSLLIVAKIPNLMALEFPQVEYHRTQENGAIICKTNGAKIDFDLTIYNKP